MMNECGIDGNVRVFRIIAEYVKERYGYATWSLVNNIIDIDGGDGYTGIKDLLDAIKKAFGDDSMIYNDIIRLIERLCSTSSRGLE